MKAIYILLILLNIGVASISAQDSIKSVSPLTISGYLDVYYSYDFNEPSNHQRQPFMYAFNRHNEFNLNIGVIKAAYSTSKIRANLGLMAGTYSNDNMSAEKGVLQNVYEANIGIKLSKNQKLWIDVGILPSHIGSESAIGMDCSTLTRSIMAENSPYFETGAKISYTTNNNKWIINALLLNGWQRIQRVDGNNTPAFGHQLVFMPSSRVTLNSSSFIGNDKPSSEKRMRYFHNFFAQLQVNNKLSFTPNFDIGWEQKEKGSNAYNKWYSFALIGKYSLLDKVGLTGRVEYYSDENNVIIASLNSKGFQTWGYSLNIDYQIVENAIWRIEGRGFSSKDDIFAKDEEFTNNNTFVTTALAVRF